MQNHIQWPSPASELPMVDVYLPMMKAAAIISAGQLRLFDALSAGPLSAAELAKATLSSEMGIGHLADFLVAVGYLMVTERGYENSPNTARWFTGNGDFDYTAGLLWTAESWGLMSNLTGAVRKGAPEKMLWESMKERPHWGPIFSAYMHAFARHLSPDLIATIELPEHARKLLDLGGSHGLHSVAFCQKYPMLHSTIVDFPSALSDTATTIAGHGLASRISLRASDLLDGDWGEGYDAVFYLSVAHNQTAADNIRVIQHIAKVLKPGGMLLIHEYLTGAPLDVYDAAFRLTLLVETATRTYSFEEISGWLTENGFERPNRFDLEPREKGTLLTTKRL